MSLSPLEVLHPDGVLHSALVVGNGCPDVLLPEHVTESGDADLVIFAPTANELGRTNWLVPAAREVAARLSDDGFAYVLAPRHRRASVVRALTRLGLPRDTAFVHDPDVATSRVLVPLALDAATYAFTHLVPTRRARRDAVLLTLRSSAGRTLVAHGASNIGIVVRRPRGRPLFAWIDRIAGSGSTQSAIVSATWRRPITSLVAHRFMGGDQPTDVLKLTSRSDTGNAPGEADLLGRLGDTARAAGASIPDVRGTHRLDGREVIVESAVAGRSAAAVLADAPQRLPAVMTRVVAWLQRWNEQTQARRPLTEDDLDRHIERHLDALAPVLPDMAGYRSWCAGRWRPLVGTTMPFVAAHNDLTMVNVFLPPGDLGVVDWEDATDGALPLVDFYYSVVDAAAAAARYADRGEAFSRCFGEATGFARRHELELMRALELTPAQAELCFHSCWLSYAARERAATSTGPFLEIAHNLLRTRVVR
jgi:hypothetical protein